MHNAQRITPRVILFTIVTFTTPVTAAIYQCQQHGQTVFSDRPCGSDARVIDVSPVRTGGRLDQGSDVEFYQPPQRRPAPDSGCPAGYIQSSDLRRMRVQAHVHEGMSEAQVRYILGDPERQDGQWWVYERRGEETGRYRFRQGCLSSWR
ncbi:DUF4124 domain-containing protein [Marinobacter mobilis]|uniref:DUF4124 domain-containing protein n=1 Tax=Marinobacter mobilis TaxID=488533 RepID=A0A1H2PXX6_9GAMM|nr:DUF4124 domain-containing protein [Marinobacter mobilis]SDV99681.1 hypothetical protein SAMN04487960_10115 [Marinobacter mobilis]